MARDRNAEARAQLEPLRPGERPGAVTVGAIVCFAGIVVLAAGWATHLIHHRHNGAPGIAASILILAVEGAGMWARRYWAVLGFQALLAINIVVMFLLLLRASSVVAVVVALAVIVPASILFWKLVRAMARLQMPPRP